MTRRDNEDEQMELGASRTQSVDEASTEKLYACQACGSTDVQLNFPVWVAPNDIDDQRRWDIDVEAQPENDKGKSWCPKCESNVAVLRTGLSREARLEHICESLLLDIDEV